MNSGGQPRQKQGITVRRVRWIAGGLVLAAITTILWRGNGPAQPRRDDTKHSTESRKAATASPQTGEPSVVSPARENVMPAEGSGSKAASADSAISDAATGPAKTRASHRDEVVTSSGKRKTQIDPLAAQADQPPWPEGPRMFAEVETSSRRYINLRPDDIGEMPRVRAEAGERMEFKMTFPEGEPGEKIYVEIPNGGAFADSEARGRVYQLPENRTLSFPFIADEMRGHCNVKLRHRGHTRSLPVWVGELPETASTESGS